MLIKQNRNKGNLNDSVEQSQDENSRNKRENNDLDIVGNAQQSYNHNPITSPTNYIKQEDSRSYQHNVEHSNYLKEIKEKKNYDLRRVPPNDEKPHFGEGFIKNSARPKNFDENVDYGFYDVNMNLNSNQMMVSKDNLAKTSIFFIILRTLVDMELRYQSKFAENVNYNNKENYDSYQMTNNKIDFRDREEEAKHKIPPKQSDNSHLKLNFEYQSPSKCNNYVPRQKTRINSNRDLGNSINLSNNYVIPSDHLNLPEENHKVIFNRNEVMDNKDPIITYSNLNIEENNK